MTSTVVRAVDALASKPGSRPVGLLGFEVTRHLARSTFGTTPKAFDLPICEETMMGAALGFASTGRHVVLDLMFEGFLARCLEPALVGRPTSAAFSIDPGVVVVRCLGGPIPAGGPAHANNVLALFAEVDGVAVVEAGRRGALEDAIERSGPGGIVIAVDRP